MEGFANADYMHAKRVCEDLELLTNIDMLLISFCFLSS